LLRMEERLLPLRIGFVPANDVVAAGALVRTRPPATERGTSRDECLGRGFREIAREPRRGPQAPAPRSGLRPRIATVRSDIVETTRREPARRQADPRAPRTRRPCERRRWRCDRREFRTRDINLS